MPRHEFRWSSLSLSLSLSLSVLHNCSQVFAACLASAFVGSVSVESEDPEHLWGRENNFQDIPCSNPITPMSKRPVQCGVKSGEDVALGTYATLMFCSSRLREVAAFISRLKSCQVASPRNGLLLILLLRLVVRFDTFVHQRIAFACLLVCPPRPPPLAPRNG